MSNMFDISVQAAYVKHMLHFDVESFMAAAEKHAWGSLIALSAIYYFFQMRVTKGSIFSEWGLADVTARDLFWVYIVVIVLSVISEAIIAAFVANKKTGDIEKDERDHFIEARASAAEHWFLVIAINIFLFHIIADAAFENHIFPSADLTDLRALVFILFTILFAGEAIKRAFTIYYHRIGATGHA